MTQSNSDSDGAHDGYAGEAGTYILRDGQRAGGMPLMRARPCKNPYKPRCWAGSLITTQNRWNMQAAI